MCVRCGRWRRHIELVPLCDTRTHLDLMMMSSIDSKCDNSDIGDDTNDACYVNHKLPSVIVVCGGYYFFSFSRLWSMQQPSQFKLIQMTYDLRFIGTGERCEWTWLNIFFRLQHSACKYRMPAFDIYFSRFFNWFQFVLLVIEASSSIPLQCTIEPLHCGVKSCHFLDALTQRINTDGGSLQSKIRQEEPLLVA